MDVISFVRDAKNEIFGLKTWTELTNTIPCLSMQLPNKEYSEQKKAKDTKYN